MKSIHAVDAFVVVIILLANLRRIVCKFELQAFKDPFYVSCDDEGIDDIHQCEVYIRSTLMKYINEGKYNPSTIAVSDESQLPLETYVWLTFQSINSVSVLDGTFSESVYVDMIWFDAFLTWDPAINCNITNLWVNNDIVYVPDFTLYNAVGEWGKMLSTQDVEWYSNGGMWYSRQGQITFACTYHMDKFPADPQACTARFGSFLYPSDHLTFNGPLPFMTDDGPTNVSSVVILPSYKSSAWEVKKVESLQTTQQLYDAEYSFLYYTTGLQRYPQFYLATAVYPETVVCIIAILGFWVTDIPSRLSLSVTALLTTMTVQWSISAGLPVSKESTWLSIYSIICIVIVALCVAESCCVAYMRLKTGLVPNWVQVLVSLSHNGRRMYRIITCNCGMGSATVKAVKKQAIIQHSEEKLKRATLRAKEAFKQRSVHPQPGAAESPHSISVNTTRSAVGLFNVAEMVHPHTIQHALEMGQHKPSLASQSEDTHVVAFDKSFSQSVTNDFEPDLDGDEDSSLMATTLSGKGPSLKVRSISRLDELVPLFSFSHWNNGKRAIDITWTHGGAALDDCVCVIFPLAYALVLIIMIAQNPGIFGG